MAIKDLTDPNNNVALIFGSTGLVGKELARRLLSRGGWKVYGVARSADVTNIPSSNYHFICCDLLEPKETQKKLCCLQDVTHIFWITWASQFPLDSRECCEQNKAMMSNALNALLPTARSLKHFSLQTGVKHYISLQGPSNVNEVHYYDEECPRLSSENNFYYTLEDLLKERLGGKVAWSVHRPGLILGSSQRAVYNFMGSLCVYGTICKHLNLPFMFGGTRECWEEMCIDGSDVRLVAEQQIWSATNDALLSTDGHAFNAINGPRFTWKQIWKSIGLKFGAVVPDEMFSEDFMFSTAMADKGAVWKEIVAKEGLVGTKMEDLANFQFLDHLFRCPTKMLVTRDKADRLGLKDTYETLDSILHWVDEMRRDKVIP
ncbi:Iridoid synthase [Heracleum sosnowskyi]|uniref:Iridoid synthase n=1 Tax=Heracleum sosnowskyi TaxID=360622 RepID=A0AAD8GYN7_9APIA|nr:Iridoid synthase [Heracleum sosnowskyi]